jgi:lysophospholipase L1-like esterase
MEFYTPEQDRLRNEQQQIEQQEDLPWVLLIGDSISQGYTPFVKELLAGRANVQRPRANCGDTRAGLARLDEWVGGRHWDIIHFNWGLHDLCHRHPDSPLYGHRDKIKGAVSVPLDEYRDNLETLVKRLCLAADHLVWASITKIPPDEAGRFEGDDNRYNTAASGIMQAYGIPTDDLYHLTCGFSPSMFSMPADVHFTEEGYRLIAGQVVRSIESTPEQIAKLDWFSEH